MMHTPVRVLVVEDSEPDAELLMRELQQGGYAPDYEVVDTPEAMAAALDKQPWDVIVADYIMPHFSGLDALRMAQERGLETPFIMVSGKISDDVAVDTMLAGAQDYVLKSNLARLAPALRREMNDARRRQRTNEARREAEHALHRAYDEQEQRIAERTAELLEANWMLSKEIADRKLAEAALRESEERFRVMADSSPVILWVTDIEGGNRFVNRAFSDFFGVMFEQVEGGKWQPLVHPEDAPEYVGNFLRSVREQSPFSGEARLRRADGEWRWLASYGHPRFSDSGEFLGHVGISLDITDRKLAEAALRESEEYYRTLFDAVDEGFCVIEMIFDEDGRPIDYRFIDINAAFERQTGLVDACGKTMRELAPGHEEHWFEIYGEVAVTGKPVRFQNRAEQLHRWYDVYAFRFGQPENRQVAILFNDITERRHVSERDHHIAEVLQNALVPPVESMQIESCSIAVKYEPALREAEVGGDFYDFFDLGEGRVGIVIGDVAGKGLLAAVYVAAAKHAIRNYAYLFSSPARIMTLANDALCKEQMEDQIESSMLTAFLAIVDTRRGVVTYSNAGHEPPVVCDAGGNTERFNGAQGIPLAVTCDYNYSEDSRTLSSGDTVVLVTDGITEARPVSTDLFGTAGVVDFLQRNTDAQLSDIPSLLLEAARSHAEGHLKDDAAIVAFKCGGNNEER